MALPVYLAMTAAEFASAERLPDHCAWMACHFSSYGTGLSNLPEQLPEKAVLILNDSTPVQNHDPEQIATQLAQLTQTLSADALLLDLQRPVSDATMAVIQAITSTLTCPVVIPQAYAQDIGGPVFLPPPPLDMPLKAYLAPYGDRDIWLEAALDGATVTVTSEGSYSSPLLYDDTLSPCFEDEDLHCKYHIRVSDTEATFSLWRTPESLHALLEEAEALGVSRAVGLYQELWEWF